MKILGPDLQRPVDCEAVLRSLPTWFGIESALRMYADDSARLPGFALEDGGRLLGFVSLAEHFPHAWEVHCMALAADVRGQGHGRRLLQHAEDWLRAQGVRVLQVKTLAASHPDAGYAETRAFYAARGYVPLEVFSTLWSTDHPALQLIKVLRA